MILDNAGENVELREMYEADVEEKLAVDWSNEDEVEVVNKNDAHRIKRVKEIIDSNDLQVAADYFHAALIFQHGNTLSDYTSAHVLAKKSRKLGDERAPWLVAATLDRLLLKQGKPQKYGTQFQENEEGEWEMCPYDPVTTDLERAALSVPPLKDALEVFKKKYGF